MKTIKYISVNSACPPKPWCRRVPSAEAVGRSPDVENPDVVYRGLLSGWLYYLVLIGENLWRKT